MCFRICFMIGLVPVILAYTFLLEQGKIPKELLLEFIVVGSASFLVTWASGFSLESEKERLNRWNLKRNAGHMWLLGTLGLSLPTSTFSFLTFVPFFGNSLITGGVTSHPFMMIPFLFFFVMSVIILIGLVAGCISALGSSDKRFFE